VQAARLHTPDFQTLDPIPASVDLPCYAGKRRAPHAYLAAALHAKDAGIPIFVHGVETIDGRITAWQVLEKQGVQRAHTLSQAHRIIQSQGIVYMDLAELSPNLHRVYQLRERLGVRSFANTVARLLNPLQCEGQLNGFFHTPYANYMAEANMYLEQPRSLIFMGAEGEPELYADRQKIVKMQQGTSITDIQFEDCGYPPYPKQAVEPLHDLLDTFSDILGENKPSREYATIQRMRSAFAWASQKQTLNTTNTFN
jgi:anthranilate phosphoribosyltransferase